jgi:hypothetical protein
MLKPLSLSVSLAVALGACSVSLAGGHHGKSLPSAQCETPSAQSLPSSQCISDGCGDVCGPVKKHSLFGGCDLFSKLKPKHEYTYEWVLKKKKVHNWNLFGHKKAGCGEPVCDSCGTYPSGQSWGSGQALGASQIPATYSAPQGGYSAPQGGQMAPAAEPPAAPAGDAAPAAPATPPPTASTGGLQLLPAGN